MDYDHNRYSEPVKFLGITQHNYLKLAISHIILTKSLKLLNNGIFISRKLS